MPGSADNGVIVNGAEPEIWKMIVSAPPRALASIMACRNEPLPLSLALATIKVAPLEMQGQAPTNTASTGRAQTLLKNTAKLIQQNPDHLGAVFDTIRVAIKKSSNFARFPHQF